MRPLSVRVARNLKHPIQLLRWWQYQRSRGASGDVILVTLPSSGTHWLRTMLAQALIEAYGLSDRVEGIRQDDLIPTFRNKAHRFKYNADPRIPRIQHSHAPYSWLFSGHRILFLARDLRDSLVSHYRVARARLGLPQDFGAFMRGETIDQRRHHDLASRIRFLNLWTRKRKKTGGFKVVHYEAMRNNPAGELEGVLDFIGFPEMGPDRIGRILEVGGRDHMQKLEGATPEAPPVQKVTGSPSRYRDYFTDADKDYFLRHVRRDLVDWFGYDYESW